MKKGNERFNGLEILTVDNSNKLFNSAIEFCQKIYYGAGILELGYEFPVSSEKIHVIIENSKILGTLAYSVKHNDKKLFSEQTATFKATPNAIEMSKFSVKRSRNLSYITALLFWRGIMHFKETYQLLSRPIYFFTCPDITRLFQASINLKTEEIFKLNTKDVSELSVSEAQKKKSVLEYIHDEFRLNPKDVFEHIPGVKITTYPHECRGFFEKDPPPDLFKVKLIK